MYYNSNRNSEDYYNAYKRELAELEAYRREESSQKIIKFLLSFIALILLLIASFYLYRYFNPLLENKNSLLQKEKLPSIVIREEQLPQSIQLREAKMNTEKSIYLNATDTLQESQTQKRMVSNLNEKDIALIVQIIMSQIDMKREKPLEEQLMEATNRTFTPQSLKKSNHYNKVVLTESKSIEVKNDSLLKLSKNLDSIINGEIDDNSQYTKAIKKEVKFRQNEMRVIIVQKGDTLSKIAKKAYGDSDAYLKIFAANPEVIKNPNQIFVGQRLRIPS